MAVGVRGAEGWVLGSEGGSDGETGLGEIVRGSDGKTGLGGTSVWIWGHQQA